ncbi:MAG: fibronectin type III domain-containing protein, partial [Lentisphaeria bacterium]|nr:fibronectin type III domain-containing protein [Lentisphaeria bacterium]
RGGDGGGYNPYNSQYSGGGGGIAYFYCIGGNYVIWNSSFVENQSGAGGAGGAGGQATGTDGQNGEPGLAGVGGAGGGVFSLQTGVELTNCTLAANQAAGKGGALALYADYFGSLVGYHLTLADNVAGQEGGALVMETGTSIFAETPVFVANSIFTGNRSFWGGTRSASDDVWATSTGMTIANSLIAGTVPILVTCSDCLAVDPLLKPLARNGGPTPTMAPAAGSPAIGSTAVDPAYVSVNDQRGFPRDDPAPDLGAFEARPQASGITVTDLTQTSASLSWTPGGWPLSVVFLRPEDSVDPRPVPEDGTNYVYGTMIAHTPWRCVYSGNTTSVNLAGLTPGTAYRVMVCSTEGELYLHNTEDALGNPLVFTTPPNVAPPVLVSPVHCPDEGAEGPEGDNPAFGHSRAEAPIFVWEPPADAAEAHFQVWLDGVAFEIGNTAIDPIGFRCFDGESWTDFPATGMPADTVLLSFRRASGGETIGVRAGVAQAREWWVVVNAENGTATSLRNRFLVAAQAWEDGDVVAGYTLIRKAQLDQLRAEANALRRLHGMGDFPFADDPLVANETPVRAVHFQELREAVAEVAGEIGVDVSAWTWTDPVLTVNQTAIKAVHVQELRDAIEVRFPETDGDR